jgi:hypothetical protein
MAEFVGKPVELVDQQVLLPELDCANTRLQRLLDSGEEIAASYLAAIRNHVKIEVDSHVSFLIADRPHQVLG